MMHIYVNIRYVYIPDGLEEGNDGDVPKVCLLHQRRESTKQDDGRPYGRQRPQAAHRLVGNCRAEDSEIEPLFRQEGLHHHGFRLSLGYPSNGHQPHK